MLLLFVYCTINGAGNQKKSEKEKTLRRFLYTLESGSFRNALRTMNIFAAYVGEIFFIGGYKIADQDGSEDWTLGC